MYSKNYGEKKGSYTPSVLYQCIDLFSKTFLFRCVV